MAAESVRLTCLLTLTGETVQRVDAVVVLQLLGCEILACFFDATKALVWSFLMLET